MSQRTKLIGAAVLALAMFVAGACSKNEPKTTVPGTWRDPDFSGGAFSSIFVIGVGRDDEHRRLYENSMVSALQKEGATAEASWGLFPQSEKLNKDEVLKTVGQRGFEAIVLTRLLSVDEQLEHVPEKTTYVPASNLDLYMLDYDQDYEVVHEPGYYKTRTTFNVETTLYTASDGRKVWWALSETVNPESVEEIIESVTTVVAKKMKSDGLIP